MDRLFGRTQYVGTDQKSLTCPRSYHPILATDQNNKQTIMSFLYFHIYRCSFSFRLSTNFILPLIIPTSQSSIPAPHFAITDTRPNSPVLPPPPLHPDRPPSEPPRLKRRNASPRIILQLPKHLYLIEFTFKDYLDAAALCNQIWNIYKQQRFPTYLTWTEADRIKTICRALLKRLILSDYLRDSGQTSRSETSIPSVFFKQEPNRVNFYPND